jgi:hypothetical protein
MSSDYRSGLPPVEAVREHEKRGGWWMSRFTGPGDRIAPQVRRLFLDEKRQIRASEDVSDAYGMAPALIAIERRPCSPDGDPMPWPGEPSEGIDSLRKALSISDQRIREQAEEIERLTALAEQAPHEETCLLALRHGNYPQICDCWKSKVKAKQQTEGSNA